MPQAVRAFLREAKPQTGDQSLVLIFPSTHQFHYDNALRNQEQVARAVRKQMNLGLELRLGDKQATVEYPAAQPEPRTDIPLPPQVSESSAPARPDSDERREDTAGPKPDDEAAPQGPAMLQHPEFKRLLHSFRARLKEFVPLEPNAPDPPIPLKANEDPSES